MAREEPTWSIGEVAERTGLSIHALRLYEREGLLARPVERAANGLVRAGPGNEHDRLALLRDHQEVVRAQIGALTASLELVSLKVGIYEDRLARGTAEGLWSPPTDEDQASGSRSPTASWRQKVSE